MSTTTNPKEELRTAVREKVAIAKAHSTPNKWIRENNKAYWTMIDEATDQILELISSEQQRAKLELLNKLESKKIKIIRPVEVKQLGGPTETVKAIFYAIPVSIIEELQKGGSES